MPVAQQTANAIGRLIRNLRNPVWVASEAAKNAISQIVVNPVGQQVYAYLRAHLFEPEHDHQGRVIRQHHVADVYRCADGHDYIYHNGTTYRYDNRSQVWVRA